MEDAAMAAPGFKDVDGHARALAKGVSWRIVGTLDTFIWSLLITKQAFSAGSIASLETITKIALFYGHERLWRLIRWAPDSHLRSIIKAVSWRLIGSFDTFMLSLLVTGSAKYAVSIATAEALTKIVLYYLHERAWRLVRWGRLEAPAAAAQPQA
ncbi:MAG TPA: DUF2061 domain-containing protein [Caulobacteraceae bacterium]